MDANIQNNYLPENKRQEISMAIDLILSQNKIHTHFVILFGSYARGDWVEDVYFSDGITYSYQSDFDLLVIIDNCSMKQQQRMESELGQMINNHTDILTPFSILVHDIDTVNKHLNQNQYFFSDIKREGIVLYNSGQRQLAALKPLNNHNRYYCALEDFDYWFHSALDFYKSFRLCLDKRILNTAAFLLHQTVERFYNAIILVYTHYKPKTHDVEKLVKMANALDNRFLKAFPLSLKRDRELFELLHKAYIDARYKKTYRITQQQLKALEKRVMVLKTLAEELCIEKIDTFKLNLEQSQ